MLAHAPGGSSGSLYISNASIAFGAYPASTSATYQCRLEVYTDSTSLWSVEDAFVACTSTQVLPLLYCLFFVDLVVIGILYVACPDGCWLQFTLLPRLRPYPMRGHRLL